MTTRISWSGLRRWEECHQLHLRTTQGKALPKNGRVFLPGNVCDVAMRRWLSQDEPPLGQMEEMVPEILRELTEPKTTEEKESRDFRPVKWKSGSDRDAVLEFCLDVVRGLEPILVERVLPFKWQPDLGFEAPIRIPAPDGKLADLLLIGRCDVVVQDDAGDFGVIDLKATANDRYLSTTLGQAVFYDIGIGHYFGDPDQPKWVGFAAPATRVPYTDVEVSEEDRRTLMARVVRMANGIWEGDWRPKESDTGCAYCSVRHVCDKFAVVTEQDSVGRHIADWEATSFWRRGVELGNRVVEADTPK